MPAQTISGENFTKILVWHMLLLIILFVATPSWSKDTEEGGASTARILVLLADLHGSADQERLVSGMRKSASEARTGVQLIFERVPVRWRGMVATAEDPDFRQWSTGVSRRAGALPVNAILCIGSFANLAAHLSEKWWPRATIVRSFEMDPAPIGIATDARVVVTPVRQDYERTVLLAARLFPGRRNVVVIGNMDVDVGHAAAIGTAVMKHFPSADIEYTSPELETVRTMATRLPSDSIVFLSAALKDSQGESAPVRELALAASGAKGDTPVFGVARQGAGHGMVGGYFLDHERAGSYLLNQALRSMEPAGSADDIDHDYFALFLDEKALTRMGIPRWMLPTGVEAEGTRSNEINAYLVYAPVVFLALLLWFVAIRVRRQAFPQKSLDGRKAVERVLVVDDEPESCRLACGCLESLGYVAKGIHSAEQAADALAEQEFEILFTDVVMPGSMDGIELAKFAKRKNPGLKVILTSGYSKALTKGSKLPGMFLPKPYRLPELERALSDSSLAAA